MNSVGALRDGVRRVNRAPMILFCVFLVSIVTTLPMAIVMREALRAHLGHSLAAGEAARSVNYQWLTEFTAQAGDIGRTFTLNVIGFAAVLDNLSTFLDRESRPTSILAAGVIYLLAWLFLSGGIIDRYARNRATHAHEFFAACGIYFLRFLRLAPMMALTYYVLFRYVHAWIFGSVWDGLTANVTAERTAFFYRIGLYAVFGAALFSANLVFDYAKVRAVVEDRRSMIGALAAALRFIRRNVGVVLLLYFMNGLLFVVLLAIYALMSPGAGPAGALMWVGVVGSQLYILARLWIRLVFAASEVSLFQSRLAYIGYVAGPSASLPEPPLVEQLLNESRIPNPESRQ